MNELLQSMYDTFYSPKEDHKLLQEFDSNYRALKELLTKEDRKILLRMIDANNQLTELKLVDSFRRGFQIASQLSSELSHYAAEHAARADSTKGWCID